MLRFLFTNYYTDAKIVVVEHQGDDIQMSNTITDKVYNRVCPLLKNGKKLRGVIFDVDGTLYNQKAVRKKMAIRLIGYYFTHMIRWRELFGIYVFRRLRERKEIGCISFEDQIKIAGEKAGLDTEQLTKAIEKWMFNVPLDLIKRYQYLGVVELIKELKKKNIKIIIYSDYDPIAKLDAINIEPDFIFFPDGNHINELKPSRKTMLYILSITKLKSDESVYIGDREEKDGASARLVNIEFIDIHRIEGK